jgi:hypothetical protein
MTAKIKLNAASGGGSISIQAPSSSSNNRVISLPDIADGTLVTSQSTLDATKLSGNLPALNGSALTNLSAGKVLQVVQTVLSSQITVSSNTETEMLNVAITPSATSSKVLVTLTSAPAGVSSGTEFKLLLYRDSTEVYGYAYYFGSGAAGVYVAGPNGMYLDSPNSTSAITYRVKLTRRWGSGDCIFNHTNGEAKTSLTAMEIAA